MPCSREARSFQECHYHDGFPFDLILCCFRLELGNGHLVYFFGNVLHRS